jgi:hypothetical protein
VLAWCAAELTVGCSSSPEVPEAVGTSVQALTAASQNHSPTGTTYLGRHETAVAYVNGTIGSVQGRWAVAWNATGTDTEAGWSYSPGKAGSSTWVPNEITSGMQFGNPGISPCSYTFAGWRGDPTLAPVTQPSLNGCGQAGCGVRAIYAMVAETSGGSSDVVAALSTNGGQSWGNASYVTDSTSCSSNNGSDIPNMASNPVSPYDTYIAWADLNAGVHYLQKIWFDTASPPLLHKQFSPALTIGGASSPWGGPLAKRHRLAFMKLPSGCSSGGEGVVIAWQQGNTNSMRCSPASATLGTNAWYVGVYDTGNGHWYGPFTVWATGTDTRAECVGSGHNILNSPDPGLAANPTASGVWVAYTVPTSFGNKVQVSHTIFECSGGSPVPGAWTNARTPEACDSVDGNCTFGINPDGGTNFQQDEWEPAIGFVINGSNDNAVMHFYGTRDDYQNTNVNVYAWESTNGGAWSPTQPIAIGVTDTGSTGETFPWPPATQNMWDYNSIGVAWDQGTFLAAWGGDNRQGSLFGANPTLETEFLQ